MKIIFIGTVEFSFYALERLISIHSNIIGVLTKKSSDFNSDFKDLTPLCINNNIPIKYVEDINNIDNIHWIKQLNPDIIFCFGWSSLIKQDLLNIPPKGIVGFHPAALPNNRGRHPLIWALVLGLNKSASTFFFMNNDADSGDIISQKEFDILYNDDAQSLYTKVIKIALRQIEFFVPQLSNNTYNKIPQNHQIANYWRKRNQKDGVIDFKMNSYAIYNLVRALRKPYVGASIYYNDQEVKIWKVKERFDLLDINNIEFGKVIKVENNNIIVKCYDNAIEIIEHEFNTLPKIGEYIR